MSLTDQTPELPKLAVTNLQALAQHGGTALAGILVSYGLIQRSQTTEILDIVTSIVLAAGSIGWTMLMHKLHAAKAQAAVTVAKLSQ